MIYICKICNTPVHIVRPENKLLPVELQVCYNCEKKKERKEIKSNLGYSRIGLNNI